MNNMSEEEYIRSQIEHDNVNYQFWKNVQNADMSLYDNDFVNFFRNGSLSINNQQYSFEDLYIVAGRSNETKKIMLVYYKKPVTDLINDYEDKSFYQEDLMLFKSSICCYHIYRLYKDRIKNNILEITDDIKNNIIKIINNYDGNEHDLVPETYYRVHRK